MRFRLARVRAMPAQLEPSILYVSEEFETAAHLCACGCGSKVRTPLGPTEWAVSEGVSGPTLHPSVGNWQRPCKSHYWIIDGQVEWSALWTPRQIEAGRAREQRRREQYYRDLHPVGLFGRFWRWLKELF